MKAKSFGLLYCHPSWFLLVGGYLDLVGWELMFFNWGDGYINWGCTSTMEGISTNLLGEMDFKCSTLGGNKKLPPEPSGSD